MKTSATFEDGCLSLLLAPETEAEKRMVGAVIGQPDGENSHWAYLDQALVRVSITYDGHWTSKAVSAMRLTVHRRGMEPKL